MMMMMMMKKMVVTARGNTREEKAEDNFLALSVPVCACVVCRLCKVPGLLLLMLAHPAPQKSAGFLPVIEQLCVVGPSASISF